MPDTMPRIPIAEADDVPPTTERTLFFWFHYDWETTDKTLGLPGETPPPIEGEWQRHYQCSLHLPIPAEHDGRTEIGLEADACNHPDSRDPQDELAYWVARRFFGLQTQAVAVGPGNTLSGRWTGNPHEKTGTTHGFTMITHGRRLRVTVEDLGPNTPSRTQDE